MVSFLNELDIFLVQAQGVVMSNKKIYRNLEIPQKVATCSASGNINARVFNAFSITGLSDRMHIEIII